MDNYSNALSEVYAIMYDMPNELIMKISTKFKNFVKEERNKEYNPDINDLVIKNKILPETVVILGFMYSSFLCSKEEKDRYNEEKNQKEEEKEEYNIKHLFNNDTLEKIERKEEIQVVEVKEKWYAKVISYIKIKMGIKEK